MQKRKIAERENQIKQISSDLSRVDIDEQKKLINDSHYEDSVRDGILVRINNILYATSPKLFVFDVARVRV